MFEKISDGGFRDSTRKRLAVILALSSFLMIIIILISFLAFWGGITKSMIYYLMFPEFMFMFSLALVFSKRLGELMISLLGTVLIGITLMQILGFEYSYILYFFGLLYALIDFLILNRAKKKGETMKPMFIWIWATVTMMLLLGTYVFAYLTADWLLVTLANALGTFGLVLWALIHVGVLFIPILAIRNAYIGTTKDNPGKLY